MDEFFDIVNIKDEVMGRASRFETHEKGYFHRAIHVFVRKDEKTWFLQRRSAKKDLDPLLWTTTCSGHVDAGESYLMAARECKEELGLNLVEDSFWNFCVLVHVWKPEMNSYEYMRFLNIIPAYAPIGMKLWKWENIT